MACSECAGQEREDGVYFPLGAFAGMAKKSKAKPSWPKWDVSPFVDVLRGYIDQPDYYDAIEVSIYALIRYVEQVEAWREERNIAGRANMDKARQARTPAEEEEHRKRKVERQKARREAARKKGEPYS